MGRNRWGDGNDKTSRNFDSSSGGGEAKEGQGCWVKNLWCRDGKRRGGEEEKASMKGGRKMSEFHSIFFGQV